MRIKKHHPSFLSRSLQRGTACFLLPLLVIIAAVGPAGTAFAQENQKQQRDEVTVEGVDRSTSQVPGSETVDVPQPETGTERQSVERPGTDLSREEAERAGNAPRPQTPRESRTEWWTNGVVWLFIGFVAGVIAIAENND